MSSYKAELLCRYAKSKLKPHKSTYLVNTHLYNIILVKVSLFLSCNSSIRIFSLYFVVFIFYFANCQIDILLHIQIQQNSIKIIIRHFYFRLNFERASTTQ